MAAKLTIKGKEYDIPAVTLGQLRAGMLEKMKRSDELSNTSWMDAIMLRGEIVAEAMVAKYGDEFSTEDVLNSLDATTTGTSFLALLGVSGITTPGEATATRTGAGT